MSEDIDRARSMLGTPFLHLGRDEHGIDCIGLLAYAKAYPASKLPPYPRDPYRGLLEQQLDAVLGRPWRTYTDAGAPVADLQPGDVLAMAYKRVCRHVGMVAQHPTLPGQLSVIHTDSTLGEVTEHRLDEKWLRRIRRVYRS